MEAAALAAGLLGGLHCAGMCGGIAGGLTAAARGPALPRQLAFNTGRIGSYMAVGVAAGALGGLAQLAGPVLVAKTLLFAVANVLMLLLGLYIAGWGRALMRLEAAGGAIWRRAQPLARRVMPIDSTAKALGAGALWGFVPCGLVYSMLALAVATGSPLRGATVMAAFGLGTLPTLLAAGFGAQTVLSHRRRPWVRRAAGLAIIGMALVGFWRIPHLQQMVLAGWHCIT